MKIKSLIISVLFLFASSIVQSQSKFSEGFNAGYKNGYCLDQGVGCLSPIPPMVPLPTVEEDLDSYQDGYNRGFEIGLNARKSSNPSSTNSTNRSRYQTAKSTFVENKMSNPYGNIDNAIALANALRESKGHAVKHLENEEYQEAANIAFAGLKVAPKDAEFMIILGEAYYTSGDIENAINWYKKASELRPDDFDLRRGIYELENAEEGDREISLKNERISPDKFAVINIYRPKEMTGSLISVDVLVNGRVVEQLRNGGYLEYKVHNLTLTEIGIKTRAGLATLRLMPQQGITYYFETDATLTGFTLEQISSPVPEEKLKKKNYSKKADYIF